MRNISAFDSPTAARGKVEFYQLPALDSPVDFVILVDDYVLTARFEFDLGARRLLRDERLEQIQRFSFVRLDGSEESSWLQCSLVVVACVVTLSTIAIIIIIHRRYTIS